MELYGDIISAGSIEPADFLPFEGVPVSERRPLEIFVEVRTEKGNFSGYCHRPRHEKTIVPKIGMKAIIRIYNAGGGWYPDNRVSRFWDPIQFEKIRVLWRPPCSDVLYGIPYEMGPGQVPIDQLRKDRWQGAGFSRPLAEQLVLCGEPLPPDWILIDPNDRPENKRWLAELEQRYPGITQMGSFEWRIVPMQTTKETRSC